MATESDFSPSFHLRPAGTFLKTFLGDNDTADNWHRRNEDWFELVISVFLGEVDDCHGLKTIWLDEDLRVSQSSHLKELAWVGSLYARDVVFSLLNSQFAWLLLHEPYIAIALALESCGVCGHFSRFHLAEYREDLVQVIGRDRFIETCHANIALHVGVVGQIFVLTLV